MTHTHTSRRWSTWLMALAICPVLACNDAEPTTGMTVDEITNGACNASYNNKKTSSSSAYATYACAPTQTFSGGEYITSLTVGATGDVVISAKNFTDYPFIAVLNDNGNGVDPTSCVTANYYSVRFSGTAGQKVYVVVDSPSAGSMNLDMRIDCQVTTEDTSALCSDGFDNDANGKTDCADPACAAFCPTEMCSPQDVLACGDTLVYGDTSGYGATDVLQDYACASDWTPNSPEHAYTFTASTTGWVNFTVSEAGNYPMLYVLDDTAGGCSPNNCVAFNYYSNKFYATAGHTYHLIVDGTGGDGQTYNYLASLVCDPPATETTCDNDVDDDGNGLIDCADPACQGTPSCQQVACVAVGTLDCDSTLVPGDTSAAGSTNMISSYACDSNVSLGGPEYAYQLGPFTQSHPVVVTLSNETTYGMISILEDDGTGCQPSSCVAENYGSVEFNAKAHKTYYAVVEGQGAPSVSYDISVVCQVPSNETGLCSDNIDNDGNGLVDCGDPACAGACGTSCTSAGSLTDSTVLLPGSTAAAGSTSTLSSYACAPGNSMPGNEYIYEYVPDFTGTALFTLSDLTNYAGIAVLHDTANSGCDTSTCIAFQYYSVMADVKAKDTYYVVVDGMQAGTLDYKISVIPNPPGSETGVCSDDIDNDGNFLIDGADPACQP